MIAHIYILTLLFDKYNFFEKINKRQKPADLLSTDPLRSILSTDF